MNPRGIVVLSGADGSGKSTISGLLIKELQTIGIPTIHQHWRPMILPSPRKFIGQNVVSDPFNPHGKKPHHFFLSLALSGYYWLDFWLGYFLITLPKIRKGYLVVAERFIYDIIMDPFRHRIQIPIKWSFLLCKTTPRPYRLFFLHGDPKILRQRKNELTVQEISDQQKRMFKTYSRYPYFSPIYVTDKSPDKIVDLIMKSIFKK